MSFFPALMLLAATATQGGDLRDLRRPAVKIATASVTIVRAERVSEGSQDPQSGRQDRQVRIREEKSLVEFF